MKQIFDNEPMARVLKIVPYPDGIYVNVNFKDSVGTRNAARRGLDTALEQRLKFPDENIVAYSFESPAELYQDKRFMRHMTNGKSHFARLPFGLEELTKIAGAPAFDNPALLHAAECEEKTDILKVLNHNYKRDPKQAIDDARKMLGLNGTDKEIGLILEEYNTDPLLSDVGYLPGVFCDIEGTLVKDNLINLELLLKLIEHSKTKPVTIWTGGDVKDNARKIYPALDTSCKALGEIIGFTTFHLRTPILSKLLFAGAKCEHVIDDLSPDRLEASYKITADAYDQI